jgi:1,4-alpha-glucan branching enzyme
MKTMIKLSFTFTLLFLFVKLSLFAQVIESTPQHPTINDSVQITFHVDSCDCSLAGFTGNIYAHTGVLTTLSADNGDWKHVIADWNVDLPKAKLEKINSTTYKLHITPNVKTYYAISDTEKVTDLAFVFRNSGGTKQSANLYKKVYNPGLTINITQPASDAVVKLQDTVFISAESINLDTPEADSIALFIDDTLKKVAYTSTLEYNFIVENSGKHWIKATAFNPAFQVSDSLFCFVRDSVMISDLPVNVTDGINYIDTSTVTFVLHAPFKDNVFLIGDFNNWEPNNEYLMNRTPDSERYWITISGLEKGKEYAFQYLVDGNIRIADPYTDKILDPANDAAIPSSIYPDLKPYPTGKTTEIASVFQTGQPEYNWEVTDFTPTANTNLVIYELLVRDFTSAGDFKTVIDSLSYLKNLGVNAVELMPVNEFEGNDSWGYNPSFYYAVDKAYGTKNDFKKLIDECHKIGMAVIMDIVLNHSYSQSPMVRLYLDPKTGLPTDQSPWYNKTCPHMPWCWGFDFNHEKPATKKFVYRTTKYWLKEYKIDGYRFDFTKGFTNHVGDGMAYDASRITILENMYDSIKKVNDKAIVIFEHLSDNSEETVLANHGIMLWGKMTDKYNEATMGYNESSKSDFSGISYHQRGWSNPNLVGYMESHDEQRLMYKNITYGKEAGDYSTRDKNTSLYRIEAAASMFFTVPGPKMIWQFGELGYDISIDSSCRVCKKPILWEYFDDPYRNRLYQVFSALIKLRTEQELFTTTDFNLTVAAANKRIHLNSANMNATIIANFDVTESSIDPIFQHTGTWYDYFSGKEIEVNDLDGLIHLNAGEYHIFTDVKLETPHIEPAVSDVQDISYGTLIVYPNPTQGIINIDIPESGNLNFQIYNITGSLIFSSEINVQSNQSYSFNLMKDENKINAGIYIYQARNNNTLYQGKLLIE